MHMKTFAKLLIIIALITWGIQGCSTVRSHYTYDAAYGNLWALADRSSTIAAKQQYIAQFSAALEAGYARGDFSRHDAIWLKTPKNSFEANLSALKTLSDRLSQIQGMNPSSFEYNTAIQQITAQEQGEASAMLETFHNCFDLANYPMAWGWISGVIAVAAVIAFSLGIEIGTRNW